MIRAAVLGMPISHSLSPVLHRAAYDALGIDGRYEAIEVDVNALEAFVTAMDESWTGLSLTMPLKEEILKIADETDSMALKIQSANTLVRSAKGWKAVTTDVNGFVQALKSNVSQEVQTVTILGSGATARAAAAACDGPGKQITIIHRSRSREKSMRDAATNATLKFVEWGRDLVHSDLVINATPSGVADLYAERLHEGLPGILFEALYNPWPTEILRRWRALNGQAIDGLELLVHQGIDQVELMSGLQVDRANLAPKLRTACLAAMEA